MYGQHTPTTGHAARAGIAIDWLIGLSDDELLRLSADNPGVRIERNRDGGLTIMSPSGSESGREGFRINTQFGIWVERTGLGEGFDASAGFSLPDGSLRSPDLAFVAQARWDALSADQRQRFAPVVPDFVLELVSPSDSLPKQKAKMEEWIANGVRLGWLIDPSSHTVWVYRPGAAAPETFSNPATVVADDDVLPGFLLDLARVWT